MKIKRIAVGVLSANCYILSDENTKEAVIIDPGDDGVVLMEYVDKEQLKVKYILNTHGHHDHCSDNAYMKEKTGALVGLHKEDEIFLVDPDATGNFYAGSEKMPPADFYIKDGDEIVFGNCVLKVIETPGHSKGGVCFYGEKEKICFTGDTLFRGSIGRADFYGGNMNLLIKCIKEKLAHLSDEVTVYAGHGAVSTMGYERRMNRYIR